MQKSLTKIWFARATQTIHCHHHYRQHVAFVEMQREQKNAALLLAVLTMNAIVIVRMCLVRSRTGCHLFFLHTQLSLLALLFSDLQFHQIVVLLRCNQIRYIRFALLRRVLVFVSSRHKIILYFVFTFHIYMHFIALRVTNALRFVSYSVNLVENC